MTEYGYNDVSQITRMTVNGNATGYEYDAAGNITAVTDAEGCKVTFTYDLNGNMTEVVYPDGTKDTTEYDALGRVVKATPRTGLATAYAYDAAGNVTSVTQGEQVTGYEYDLLGHLIKQTAADGTETSYEYDALGNLIGQTDPLNNKTQFSYNAESLLEMVTYANGTTQSLGYDLAGNVTSETDGEGNVKQYEYDKVNRLTAVIDEMGSKTSYKYDALDNIAQVTDALKHVTKYTYDKNGNLTSETDALGNKVEYAYTPEGWLSSITKADGTVQTFTYDKTGNLLTQNVGEGQSISSDYNEIGMVTKVSSTEGTLSYQYNDKGYLVSVTNVNGDVVRYTYDQYGNKASMTYPDGRMVSYTYDAMNRMTSVTGLDGEVTSYAYDAAGRRVETKTGSGTAASTLTTTYRYDSVGNLLEQATSGASSIAFKYSYNKNSYITGEVRTEDGKTTESTYTYDPLGEVTSFLQSTGYGEQYSYDRVGNMLQKVITPATTTNADEQAEETQSVTLKMKYNKGNQLTSMANGRDAISYSYDKNGSMVQKVLSSKQYGKLTDTYAYNALDQLVSYTGYDGYQQTVTYDANGMRLTKAEAGNGERSTLEELLRGNIAGLPEIIEPTETQTNEDAAAVPAELEWATTEYLYDITQEYYQVIGETAKSGNSSTTTAYAYGLERIAAYSDGSKTSYAYDGRGSVVQAISAPVAGQAAKAALPTTAVKVQSFSYTAFGEQMGKQKISGFGYNAEAFDAATGMINLRARQYEPILSRFCLKDIIGGNVLKPISGNRYAYVANSPLCYCDTSGMLFEALKNSSIGKAITGFVAPVVKTATAFVKKAVSFVANAAKSVYSRNKSEKQKQPVFVTMGNHSVCVPESALTLIEALDGKLVGPYTESGKQDVISSIRDQILAMKGLSDTQKAASLRYMEKKGYLKPAQKATATLQQYSPPKEIPWYYPVLGIIHYVEGVGEAVQSAITDLNTINVDASIGIGMTLGTDEIFGGAHTVVDYSAKAVYDPLYIRIRDGQLSLYQRIESSQEVNSMLGGAKYSMVEKLIPYNGGQTISGDSGLKVLDPSLNGISNGNITYENYKIVGASISTQGGYDLNYELKKILNALTDIDALEDFSY